MQAGATKPTLSDTVLVNYQEYSIDIHYYTTAKRFQMKLFQRYDSTILAWQKLYLCMLQAEGLNLRFS